MTTLPKPPNPGPHPITVENAARTAQFLVMMETRRRELREQLARILGSSPDRPVVWEIGCGHGHFLTAYAQAHPQELCIGIDIVSERVGRAAKKRDRAKLPNLHFIHAEARLFLEQLPAAVRLARVFVLFPDPWPKSRHHKHRIMQPEFLADLAARVGEGTRLYFRTDFIPYFDDTVAIFREHPQWDAVEIPGESWPFEHETVFQSRAPSYHSLIARLRQPAVGQPHPTALSAPASSAAP